MNALYQDAMTMVRHYGKPDLFVTFTCNPKWPEIQCELMEGQDATDRPDLVVRVFHIKFQAFLTDIIKKKKKGVLGNVIAYTWVIEFQKRGLPHAHMLLILDPASKIKTVEAIDSVSAEIPDRETCPLAYETVTTSMVHGPCGAHNPESPCMETKKVNGEDVLYCTKNYPKPLSEETVMNNQSYPQYRRRPNGPIFRNRNNIPLDNPWIVPHNLFLTTKYNAHINVEVCCSIAAVKYLFKYVYKGHDRTNIELHPAVKRHRRRQGPDDVNEVENFQDARYVSSCEALWRIFRFKLHARSPSVKRLQVHLEDHQTVLFDADDNLQDVVDAQKNSCLMAWFKLNANDPEARNHTYPEIPKYYTWGNHSWKRRTQKRSVITRMYFVHPKDRERFCLRLLLTHVKGATSFQDLRTVPDPNNNKRQIVYNTFRKAALARELLDSDQEWTNLLQEAAVSQMPASLRHLFSCILSHCSPSDPLLLWLRFAPDFSEDYLRRLRLNNPVQDLECNFEKSGRKR